MRRFLFWVCMISMLSVAQPQEVFEPGKAALVEVPVPGLGTVRGNPLVSGLLNDLSLTSFCYVKRVSLVRKGGSDFASVEIIPWLEGENKVASFFVNGKEVNEFSVRAELDPTSLYVPQPRQTLEHEGLRFRLLLDVIAVLCLAAACVMLFRSRKRLFAFLRLRYSLILCAYRLRTALHLAERSHDFVVMDKAVRLYVESVTGLLSTHFANSTTWELLRSRSLTVEELTANAGEPNDLKTYIIDLLAELEGVRWKGTDVDFGTCVRSSLRLPGLVHETMRTGKNTKGEPAC